MTKNVRETPFICWPSDRNTKFVADKSACNTLQPPRLRTTLSALDDNKNMKKAKVYDSGSRRGGDYDIEPVYFIGILGRERIFEMVGPEWAGRYISEYTFREKHTGEVPDESISLIFVELDRFVKPLDECVGLTEKWCYALKYVGKLHGLPEGLRVQAFERLFAACEIARFSRDKKLQYEKDMITERDYRNILETARENGFAAGKAEVARTMLTMGLSDEVILQATGLSEAELAGLKEDIQPS